MAFSQSSPCLSISTNQDESVNSWAFRWLLWVEMKTRDFGDAVLLTLRSVSLLPAKDVKEWMGVKCSGKAAKWKVLNK